MNNFSLIMTTGCVGLLAAVLVGVGEFLLHFTKSLSKASTDYSFMQQISRQRQIIGHFMAVLFAPFYLIGLWHIFLMLGSENRLFSIIIILISAYGFIIGTVWIGSRGLLGTIIRANLSVTLRKQLLKDYRLYDESLIQIVRVTTLIFSGGFIYKVLSGNTYYPTWMAIFNPFLILIVIFLIYYAFPKVGKYIIPIALNVAYSLFFALSIFVTTLGG